MLAMIDHGTTRAEHETEQQSILLRIRKGMRVVDAKGEAIGSVHWVYPGDASVDEPPLRRDGVSPVHANGSMHQANDDLLAGSFAADDEAGSTTLEATARRLLTTGFARIDGEGLAPECRYFTPDQVERVDENGVHLTIARSSMRRR
jgi:hypothetical protein